MARAKPHVEQGTLTLGAPGAERTIVVGTPDWFEWLETVAEFTFASAHGAFSARRERSNSGRGGWHWLAYYDRDGRRRRAYLGKSTELSLDRLHTVAAQLASAGAVEHKADPTAVNVQAPRQIDGLRPNAGAPVPQLLATKLYVPRVRPDLVARPRLFARLDAGLQGKLTLVCAPAGFGKTTLLAEWLRRIERPSSWLSLDTGDSDPVVFLRYLVAALQALTPQVGAALRERLQSAQPPLEILLTALVNDLAMVPHAGILVLDDYHLLQTPAIHQAVSFLLDHLPPTLHLVIASREDPPLPLARLRASRQITELRAEQLRFSSDEAVSFLTDAMALPLTSTDVAALVARTEGWVAGLQLAALAMQDRDDHTSFIATFTGSNRFVVDYLTDEVLARLPGHIQTFLLETSILERMCGPLCDAVLRVGSWESGDGDERSSSNSQPPTPSPQAYSQLILEQLERTNLFVITLDSERRWYRYHHLFAQVLRQRLISGARIDAVAALHQRASAWFERAEMSPDAIEHMLAAQDWERAAQLIERSGLLIAVRGQAQTVLSWLAMLPKSVIRRRVSLCIINAATLIMDNQPRAIEPVLQDAEACARDMAPEQARLILGQINALRAASMRISGDLERALALAQQALELLPEAELFWRAPVASNLSRAFLINGDVTPAVERTVAHTIEPARSSDNPFAYLAAILSLARLRVLQGRLRSAAATYREALQLVPNPTALRHYSANLVYYFGLGDLLREWNDLDAAEHHLAEGMEVIGGTRSQEAEFVLVGYLALVRLKQARGDIAGAATAVAAFLDLARQRGFAQLLIARAVAVQAQLALVQGNLAAAAAWAEASAPDLINDLRYLREVEHLALARVWITLGREEPSGRYLRDAIALLAQLLGAAEARERYSSVIEIRILQALAFQAQAGTSQALVALESALQRAAPENYVRIFVDEGLPMAALLHEAHQRGIAPVYIEKLLAAFGELRTENEELRSAAHAGSQLSIPNSQLPEPLTARELEVLRLLAEGASNTKIAERLIISLGTAKKHIANIYGKLDVQSRTQALARACTLGLL